MTKGALSHWMPKGTLLLLMCETRAAQPLRSILYVSNLACSRRRLMLKNVNIFLYEVMLLGCEKEVAATFCLLLKSFFLWMSQISDIGLVEVVYKTVEMQNNRFYFHIILGKS